MYIILYIKYVKSLGGKKTMRKRCFRGNNEGDVLGIPMYLIIIMIVAVAVIAAVVVMIPKGTRAMNAQVTANALIAEDPGNDEGGEFTFDDSYTIWVKVTTNDPRADPISGATVTLVGAGDAGHGKTYDNGSARIAGIRPKLDANINEAYMTLTVKAAGYDDFVDDTAVTVMRLG
jgi:hypothetical protein